MATTLEDAATQYAEARQALEAAFTAEQEARIRQEQALDAVRECERAALTAGAALEAAAMSI